MDETEGMVRQLACLAPSLASLLVEHEVDNHGAVLPHVFLGDVTRWMVRSSSDPDQDEAVKRVLDFLQTAFEHGEASVRELVTVSFLENLPSSGEPGSELIARLSDSLAEQRRRLDG